MNAYLECSKIEQKAEDLFFPAFESYLAKKGFYIKPHRTQESQMLGDYTIYNDNISLYIDRKHEKTTSPNIFFELYSNRNIGRLGWGVTSKSKYIVYSFSNIPIYCFINIKKLQSKIDLKLPLNISTKNSAEYYNNYKVINQSKYNQRNLTQGILIPFASVQSCIDKVVKIVDNVMIDCPVSEFLNIAKRV